MCRNLVQVRSNFAFRNNKKDIDMNTDLTFANISSMISSEASYRTLLDMINEMDLELTGISLV